MKGQYRVVNEVFLFAIGVIITIFILMNFQDLDDKTKEYSARDQLQQISNAVSSAIIKARESSTIKLYLGKSTENYRIAAENNYLTVSLADNPKINITRFLNMGEYNIKGDVVSDYIIIVSNGTTIEIKGL